MSQRLSDVRQGKEDSTGSSLLSASDDSRLSVCSSGPAQASEREGGSEEAEAEDSGSSGAECGVTRGLAGGDGEGEGETVTAWSIS